MRFGRTRFVVASLFLASSLASERAVAVIRGIESFESYSAGSALFGGAGGTGWTGEWSADVGAEEFATVESKTIIFDGQSGGSQAGLIGGLDFGSAINRPFAPVSDTLYLGFLVRTEEWDDDFIQFQVSNGAVGNASDSMTIGLDTRVPANGGFYSRIGTSGQGSTFTSGAVWEVDTDYFLVGKFSKEDGSGTYNRVDLFVNPEGTLEPEVPDATREAIDSTLSELSLFTIRTAVMEDAGESLFIDELRVATSFPEVLLSGSDLPDPGDFNDDGSIDLLDYEILKGNFQEPGDFTMGDFNYNGFVDLFDFGLFVEAYGAQNAAAVPEPNALAMISLLVGAGLAARGRRRGRANGM